MAERSFKSEVAKLRLGAGEEFRGEGILGVTKALLQSGVSYVSGYQGAPISHLVDVLADADDVLRDLGVRFEASANEAAAAAALAASINYPLRGAATFKSTVGTNVASDALANLASSGVTGGALIIVGEDYGEGSSIMQERSHAFAMKSQIWLLDPRPNLPSIVHAVETGFELSEASNTPVMLELRIRACHVYGSFTARDLPARAGKGREALARRRALHRAAQAQRGVRWRGRRHRYRHAGRHVQYRAARARNPRARRRVRRKPRSALRAQRHLSADRCRARALLRGQESDSDHRGGPAGIHRAGGEHDPAPRRRRDPGRGEEHVADGGRIYRRCHEGGRAEIHRGLSRRFARRWPHLHRFAIAVRAPGEGPAGGQGKGARPPALVLHRLPRTADLRRHEAGRA